MKSLSTLSRQSSKVKIQYYMKSLLTVLTIMAMTTLQAQDGKASTERKTFSLQTEVSIKINSDAAIVWALLTNASDFPRWNSTVISIEGDIALGNKIYLKSTLDPERTFKLKIKQLEADIFMEWGDGKGNRVFTITKNEDGSLQFSMVEKIGGLMFPMYAKYLPPFDESFEQYARDLKTEAELIYNAKN